MENQPTTITATMGHNVEVGDLVYVSGLSKHWFKRLMLWLAFWYKPKPLVFKVDSVGRCEFAIKD